MHRLKRFPTGTPTHLYSIRAIFNKPLSNSFSRLFPAIPCRAPVPRWRLLGGLRHAAGLQRGRVLQLRVDQQGAALLVPAALQLGRGGVASARARARHGDHRARHPQGAPVLSAHGDDDDDDVVSQAPCDVNNQQPEKEKKKERKAEKKT